MPLPVVPLASGLGSLLGMGFAGLVGTLSAHFTRKTAIAAALAAFLIAGWVAIQATVYAAWLALGWVMPAELSVPVGMARSLLPSNTAVCIQAIVLTKIGRWLWDGQADFARALAAA